jgi:hypothetical protein
MTGKKEQKVRDWERHGQTILTGIVAGLICWVGVNVSNQGKEIAILNERVINLQSQMVVLQNFAREPRFTKDDFYNLTRPYEQRIQELETRLNKRSDWSEGVDRRITILESSK